LLERSVAAAGGVVRRWPVVRGRFDAARLEALVTPRTRLISLCNPHNPLGRVLRREELEAIAVVALRHDLWILSDEVWSDIVYRPHAHVCMATLDADVAARTFTVFGFSKSYGLAGMRLGLLAAPDAAQRDRLMTLAHAGDTAYGASTVSQVAGAAAYELADEWLARFRVHLGHRRDQAVARLAAIPGVRCAVPEGTFVAFPDVSRLGVDQDELAGRLLDRHAVAVVPGSRAFFGPGAAGHLRLSFATSRGILADGLDRVEAGLRSVREAREAAAG
ncbi:MAG: pyridoxal phosphate-dependent aminotransferase, partial [Solirubrobacteraceae bacterium]